MLLIRDRIESLAGLGAWLKAGITEVSEGKNNELAKAIQKAGAENPWFTKDSILQSIQAITGWLDPMLLTDWSRQYFLSEPVQVKKIVVIMAGNIPLVNFHDFLAVLLTGHQFVGKLSSQDKILLPFLADKLLESNKGWTDQIAFAEGRLENFDAVIATGSTNTSRYFEYYFGKYPHVIRKNRNSIAILTGNESENELKALYSDIFQYFGMGCRNVSMLLVPKNYNFPSLFDQWEGLSQPTEHHKYRNNYDYYRSIYLVNLQPFYDTGYVSVVRNESPSSPVSVLHYMEYNENQAIEEFIRNHETQIQCIVSVKTMPGYQTVLPGQSQCPTIVDYPDGVDIIQFLLAL